MTADLARITLTHAGTRADSGFPVCLLSTSYARFPCMPTRTALCMAWPNPPTEERPRPKHLVYQNKFYTFQNILALFTASLVLFFFMSINVLRNVQQWAGLFESRLTLTEG